MTCYFYLWLIITLFYPLRTLPACKHDQNTYLDLFVSNIPIKHILCMLLSGLGSHEEVAEWKMGCFQALGRKIVNNAQSLEKNSVLPKCFQGREERRIKEKERYVDFHNPKSLRGVLYEVPDMAWPLFPVSHRSYLTCFPTRSLSSPLQVDLCKLNPIWHQFESHMWTIWDEPHSQTKWG